MDSYTDAATSGTAPAVTRRPKAPPEPAGSEDISAELRETFGTNLRAAREAAGLSLQAAADRMGSDTPYLSRIERGLLNITFATAARLAQAVDADVRDLLGGPCTSRKPANKKAPRR